MAQVTVEIGAKLDKRPLADVTDQIHRLAQLSGTDFTKTFERNARLDPKMPNSAKFVTEGAKAGRAFSDGFNAAASRGIANSRRGLNDLTRGVSEFDTAAKTATRSLGNLSDATGGAIASAVSNVNPAGIIVIGTAATAAAGAVGMLGGAVAELSGVIGLLPGFIAAPVAAIGALKLATQGFGDALGDLKDPKKFAEDLKELSPNAQQAALAIRAMVPAFDALKNSAQDALFAGVGQDLNQLAGTYLPAIQQMTTTISGAFNSMFKNVADQLLKPETQSAIQLAMANIGQAFTNLVPAVGPVTRAISDLVNVSTSFLPSFGTGLANLATQFSDFLSNAAKTGELKQWINDGVEAVKSFGPVLTAAKDLFSDFKENGKTAMGDIVWAITKVIEAIDWVADKYTMLSNAVKNMANITVAAFNTVGSAISTGLEPLRWLINAQNKINPVLDIPTIPQFTPIPAPAPGFGGNILERGAVTPGHAVAPPGLHPGTNGPGLGGAAGMTPGTALPIPAYPGSGYAVPGVPASGGGSKGDRTHGPEVAYSGDPMSLIQGYQATSALYGAAGSLLDKQHQVAQLQADLNKMVASNTATEDELTKKRNQLAIAQREEHEAELRLNEAKMAESKKLSKGMQDLHEGMSDMSAGLDKDLGFSKGLPGLADNLVRFVGALATAPLKALLDPIAKQGDGSSGLLGMAFGGLAKDQQPQSGSVAYPSIGTPGYAGINSDAALLANVRPGRYSQDPGRDLLKGLSDCSSSIGDLVNIMDGRSTGGQKLTTGNAADWLPAHGFMPGMGGPGDFRVGYNSGHMQATLPGGTPWNWGSDAAAARGGVGGTGADDPAFNQHYYRPTGGLSAPSLPALANSGNVLPPLTQSQMQGLPFSMPGGPLSSGMPRGLPGAAGLQGLVSPAPYSAQATPTPQQGWQPQGGGGIGFGGGLIGMGMDAAAAAASTVGAPFGGAAGAAAAKMAQQLIDRTVKFGGQAAGIATQGILSTFSPSNPDTGASPMADSWIFRVASALAGATPALGSGGAAMLDKQAEKRRAEEQGAQQNQQQPQQAPQQSGPLVNIETMNNGQNSGKSIGIDIASQLAQQQYTR